MGVIDEVKPSDSSKDEPSLPINPSLSTPKDDSGEVSVPQMLITSVEEVNQELAVKEQNLDDEKPALTTIKEENEEEKEKKDVFSAQQRPLVISSVSESSHEAVEESSHDHEKQQPPRTESPPLSAIQRPLVFEQVPSHSVSSGVQETQPEPTHDHISSTSPSAVQRPLVIDSCIIPSESAEQRTSSQLETEIDVDIREQNGAIGFTEPSPCPVLSARHVEEISYESSGDTAGHDAHKPEEISSSPIGSPETAASKIKGFFTKADGTSIFSLPKFNIGSSKEQHELPKEEKDAVQIQATSDETHVESEKALSTDQNVEEQVKEDNKSSISLPDISSESFREPKSMEHYQGSSPNIHPHPHPTSKAAVSAVVGKQHSKEGSKVTFSLPRLSFSSSRGNKETLEHPEPALSQSVESPPSSTEVASPGNYSAEVAKEGGKHGFHLPKFGFGSSKEKEIKGQHDSTLDQSVESRPSSTEVPGHENYTAEAVKEGSKHGFHFPKFSFGSSKESKEIKDQHDSTLSQSIEGHSSSAEAADHVNYSAEVKEETKHGFHLPKFGFGSPSESKKIKDQHDSTLNESVESRPSSAEVADRENYSAEVKDGTKHGFHLPKFGFGSPSESKKIKDQHDSTINETVESRPSSAEVADHENYSADLKEGTKHGFHLPKFGFGSPSESKKIKDQHDSTLNESVESRPSPAEVTDRENYSAEVKEGTKHGFHLPKFGFGSPSESKKIKDQHDSTLNESVESRPSSAEVTDRKNYSAEVVKEGSSHGFSLPTSNFSMSTSAEKSPNSAEIKDPKTTPKDGKEDGKHAFQFPKFTFGGSREQKERPQEQKSASPDHAVASPTDSVKVMSVESDSKPSSPESSKPMFSMPKFSFGISKDSKDASHVQRTSSTDRPVSVEVPVVDTSARDIAKEDSKHSFSFPKFGLGSPKTPKKERRGSAEIPAFVVEDFGSTKDSKVDSTKVGVKRSFSFPKFSFGSSKEEEASKEPKDSSKVAKSDAEAKVSVEDHKHAFSFPKFGLSSSKDAKEIPKHPIDSTQTEASPTESYPVSTGSVETPSTAKPFSFPKISFGSFREHKATSKEQKDLESSHVACESEPGVAQVKGDAGREPEPLVLKGDDGKSVETRRAAKKGAPLASEEKDPFIKPKKPQAPERASSFKMFKREAKETPKEPKTESPSSLYETCCMRLAGMICNKAMEIVSEHTTKHGPPKKPPKPSAETIAKARAAIVAKRVQEYERRRNFGDDIPLGYNGIRFVDDDTESSTDYKDVDNTAYIIDSDCSIIVRRMKNENIIETFSCPSTCSYYTADEMTLKDGNFSDNTLESVSLGSEDSLVYKPALSSPCEEVKFSPTVGKADHPKTDIVKKPVEKQKSSPVSFFFFGRNKSAAAPKETPTPVVQKRVPPPIPPKPRNWPRSESEVNIEAPASKPEVKKCVDSLSLSPRPVTRNLPATFTTFGAKKRPLTIAGIKETEFPTYMRNVRAEETPKKPILPPVVKNQSLEKVPVISASTSALDRSLFPSSKPSDIQATSLSSLTKKSVPQRPPPPTNYSKSKSSSALYVQAAKEAPDAVKVPKATSSVVSPQKPAVKPRPHISPPRPPPPPPPPPPQVKKPSSPPPRPPPPTSVITDKISQSIGYVDIAPSEKKPLEDPSQEMHKKEVIFDKSEISDTSQSVSVPAEVPPHSVSEHLDSDQVTDVQQSKLDSKLESSQKTDVTPTVEYPPSSVQSADLDQTLSETVNQNDLSVVDISTHTTSAKQSEDVKVESVPKSGDLDKDTETAKAQGEDGTPIPSVRISKKPKPPPRTRRIRSRTVEIVSVVWKPEEKRRRSQSLTDVDVGKRLDAPAALQVDEKPELKALYTSVHKDPAKGKSEQLTGDFENYRKSPSPEKISSRPLPPPPPPPRSKHHSESQKPKLHVIDHNRNVSPEIPEASTEREQEKEAEEPSIKPPVRKKKEEKLRSRSLEDKEKGTKSTPPLQSGKTSVSVDRASSFTSGVPKKPRRKPKVSSHEFHFDENANIAESIVESPGFSKASHTTRSHSDLVTSSSSKNSVKERSSSEKQVKRRSPALDVPSTKSHSSWYDESDVSGDLGDVDTLPGSLKTSTEKLNFDPKKSDAEGVNPNKNKQLRAKQDSIKKPRETSKFYVDFDANECEGTPVPPTDTEPHLSHTTVDKETSPLPLECSEKSVQTSLETLSQGMVSRSEQSDDTDELLDLAQTLQDELKIILSRNKKQEPEDESDCDTSGSQNQLDVPGAAFEKAGPSVKRRERKPHGTRGAASSDLWQISSSDESDESDDDQMKSPSESLLEKKKKRVFYIAQEIMTSEEAFVEALKLLNIDFRNVVDEANKQRGSPVVPSDVMNQILNHLPQLQHLNENLLMELKDRIQHWDSLGKIADVIVKMGPFLKLYSWYIQDFESMVSLLDDAKKKYPAFAQVVKEFENTPRCNRLALNHYMLKPVQRIPQYRLLLQEYLHHLPKDSPDYNDTLTALQIVSEVANHANESMKQGDNFQKLISIQNSILGHKEIIKPGRVFVKEGELMKLSRKGMQPRWFVLLSDVLLYLTPVQQGLFRVNHELTLTGMKVAIPIQQDYQNEFSIISVTRSFTLAAKSPEERQEWIVALTKAIEENASKRSTFTNVRLQQKSQGGIDEDDDESFVLGRKAPVWIPDARVTMCQLCTSEFTVTFRRHHCRACGKVVCSVCSSNRTALHYLGNRNARVCDECYLKMEQGSGGGYTESGETDSDNQQIAVKAHLRTESRHGRKPKRQLPSVLKEVCANDQGSSVSGYLLKKSGKSWKRDWFVVKDKVLYEYRASEDVAALRSLPLLGYQIETFSEPFEGIDSMLLFQLTHPGQPPVVFHADNAVAAERWISALREAAVLE